MAMMKNLWPFHCKDASLCHCWLGLRKKDPEVPRNLHEKIAQGLHHAHQGWTQLPCSDSGVPPPRVF